MNYTKEQIDIMIKSACDTQKQIDYKAMKSYLEQLEKGLDSVKETLNYILEIINL